MRGGQEWPPFLWERINTGMISFKQYLVEASYTNGKTLKTIPVQGTYINDPDDKDTKRGAWKGIRMLQTGRGWHAERIIVLLKPEPIMVEVVKELDKKYARVNIISGSEQPTVQFAKRPYTSKKTGVPNPNVLMSSYGRSLVVPLSEVYGIFGNEMMVRKGDLE